MRRVLRSRPLAIHAPPPCASSTRSVVVENGTRSASRSPPGYAVQTAALVVTAPAMLARLAGRALRIAVAAPGRAATACAMPVRTARPVGLTAAPVGECVEMAHVTTGVAKTAQRVPLTAAARARPHVEMACAQTVERALPVRWTVARALPRVVTVCVTRFAVRDAQIVRPTAAHALVEAAATAPVRRRETAATCSADCGPTSCGHSTCVEGGALANTCDPCVSQICAVDSYCCVVGWDATCIWEVRTSCGLECNDTCGDYFCDADFGETCSNCAEDCGSCVGM